LKVLVVGAGLFGSIIAATIRRHGHEVVVLADQRDGMGSVPAACLMKPEWASSMGKDYGHAIELLDHLYGVQTIPFKIKPSGLMTNCHWVDPAKVLRPPDRFGTYKDTVWPMCEWPQVARWEDNQHGRSYMEGYDKIIFATGNWAWEQMANADALSLQSKGGWGFLFEGQLDQPFIQVWAPYKQIVAFNRDPDHIWIGDGSALLPMSMTEERMQASLNRCAAALAADPGRAEVLYGYRPYMKGLKEPAYIREITNGWIVTGGAKNGTLGAAWAAIQLTEKLRT
jgi:hypothetical protein